MKDITVRKRNFLSIDCQASILDDHQLGQALVASHLGNRGEVVRTVGDAKRIHDVVETPMQKGAGADCGLGPQVLSGGEI